MEEIATHPPVAILTESFGDDPFSAEISTRRRFANRFSQPSVVIPEFQMERRNIKGAANSSELVQAGFYQEQDLCVGSRILTYLII